MFGVVLILVKSFVLFPGGYCPEIRSGRCQNTSARVIPGLARHPFKGSLYKIGCKRKPFQNKRFACFLFVLILFGYVFLLFRMFLQGFEVQEVSEFVQGRFHPAVYRAPLKGLYRQIRDQKKKF